MHIGHALVATFLGYGCMQFSTDSTAKQPRSAGEIATLAGADGGPTTEQLAEQERATRFAREQEAINRELEDRRRIVPPIAETVPSSPQVPDIDDLRKQCEAQQASEAVHRKIVARANQPVPVPMSTIAKFCRYGWDKSLNGARAEVRSFGNSSTIEIVPGVEPWVDCKPGTPEDVEQAAVRLVNPPDPGRRARLSEFSGPIAGHETGVCRDYAQARMRQARGLP